MLPLLSLCILALAVSLDGFGVGIMYGLRKIRIPLKSIIIISCCSGIIIFSSMQVGLVLMRFISPELAKIIGAVILIGIGIWAIVSMMMQRDREDKEPVAPSQQPLSSGKRRIITIEIKTLGLVIEILKRPAAADVDRSGNISSSEAALLGIALSLDAFGAGIGAAMIGLSPWTTPIFIAVISGAFVAAGLRLGFLFAETAWIRNLSILPGIFLILIGVMKLF
jgi:putative sporulation protein YtaF